MKHILLGALMMVVFATVSVWWTTSRWDDCRQVGHGMFYCVMSVMR